MRLFVSCYFLSMNVLFSVYFEILPSVFGNHQPSILQEYATSQGIEFVETSAKESINVEKAFMVMSSQIKSRMKSQPINEKAKGLQSCRCYYFENMSEWMLSLAPNRQQADSRCFCGFEFQRRLLLKIVYNSTLNISINLIHTDILYTYPYMNNNIRHNQFMSWINEQQQM